MFSYNKKQNGWDLLVDRFSLDKEKNQIHPDAAVNVFVGWPILFEKIEELKNSLEKETLDILDFGCGTGSFCIELKKQGHNVTGTDKSPEMLSRAKENVKNSLDLFSTEELFEDKSDLRSKFDTIVSIHSLEWIQEIEEVLTKLKKMLRKEGVFIFAVFPKEHVVDSIKIGDLFENFDSKDNPTQGIANFDGVKIPVFIRNPEFFDAFFTKNGFEKIFEEYPEYPKEFLDAYSWEGSSHPEMVILAYKKK